MATAALRSLRDRLIPPARPAEGSPRAPDMERALALASLLFDVATVALVLATPDGLVVTGASGGGADGAREAACRLFEILAAADPGASPGGVLEEVAPRKGFVAAAPLLSAGGRCLGAVTLLDPGRLTLLSAFQRRLLAEIGGLLASRLDEQRDDAAKGDALREAASRVGDAFALFDHDGRCLLRNGRFDALLSGPPSGAAFGEAASEARGEEAGWIAARLMRDRAPVGVYRAALADGTWLTVEERRGSLGRSLIARLDDAQGFGDPEARLLFDRCPLPMFVFETDGRGILAANAAALSLYGWEQGAFLRLDLDAIGPVPLRDDAGGPWMHRTRDGRTLAVTGRATALAHRGRPAVLVTVMSTLSTRVRPA